jgi:hypothetical protein
MNHLREAKGNRKKNAYKTGQPAQETLLKPFILLSGQSAKYHSGMH